MSENKSVRDGVHVQILDKGKGKPRESYISIKQPKNSLASWTLEIADGSNPSKLKSSISLRRCLSEMKGPDTIRLITAEQEIEIQFKRPEDAAIYHNFISDRSEVVAENKAITQLDDEMRLIWPFPGGSFFW